MTLTEPIDKDRCLEDVTYLARNVLGMDYWKDWQTGKTLRGAFQWQGDWKTNCGVADWGPHKKMADFLDEPNSPNKILLASRGSLKTSLVQAKIIQDILRNPDIRILFGSEKYTTQAKHMIRLVKNHFENNPILRDVFGNLVGDPWSDDGFVVATRKQVNLKEPTLCGFGTDKVITGGHYDKCYYDDPVSWQQAMSLDQMEKAIRCYQALIPIMDPGSEMVITMTPYDEHDMSYHIRTELGDHFKVLEIPCGMLAQPDGKGGYKLVGEPVFPHMPAGFLKQQLERMGPADFNAQYAMIVENPADQVFFREQFGSAVWQPRFQQSAAYVLTDTATTDQDSGCHSVIAVGILDHDDVFYLADLRVGLWRPDRFVTELCDVVQEWRSRVSLQGIVMEKIGLNKVFRSQIEQELRLRGTSYRFIEIPRGVHVASKNQRIRGLVTRFVAQKFKVLDTCPKVYEEHGKTKLLWEPHGFLDPETGRWLPDGELVQQFVRFRFGGGEQRVDIPDALADIDLYDTAKGKRFLHPTPPSIAQRYDQERRGLPHLRDYANKRRRRTGGDWWDDLHRGLTGS